VLLRRHRNQKRESDQPTAKDLADTRSGATTGLRRTNTTKCTRRCRAGYTYHGVHYTEDQSAVASGDHCLSILIPLIEASQAFKNNGVIILWTDETVGGDTAEFNAPEVVISPLAKGNAYDSKVPVNHSSDLKTMQENFPTRTVFWTTRFLSVNTTLTALAISNRIVDVHDLSDLFVPGTNPGRRAERGDCARPACGGTADIETKQ